MCHSNDDAPSDELRHYGYHDEPIDVIIASNSDKYGYGEAAPDIASKYGYEEAAPDFYKYGYGEEDACYDGSHHARRRRQDSRSSLKREGAPRRASISYTGEIENILPGSRGQPVRRRTSISFDDSHNSVIEVRPALELVKSPKKLWFQADEYGLIRERARILADLAGNPVKDERCLIMGKKARKKKKKFCVRGLESQINSAYIDSEQNLAWESVFSEQYYQRKHGGYDEDALAKNYETASLPSLARAIARARGDFEAAEKHTRGMLRAGNGRRRHSLLA